MSILFVVYKIGVSDKNCNNAQILHSNCEEIVFYRSTSDCALTILCIVDSVPDCAVKCEKLPGYMTTSHL